MLSSLTAAGDVLSSYNEFGMLILADPIASVIGVDGDQDGPSLKMAPLDTPDNLTPSTKPGCVSDPAGKN